MQSSKRTFSQRILTRLINSNKEKYISYLSGREVMNWMAINTDAKKIEKICHGAVPSPNDDLQGLIQKLDTQEKLSSFGPSTSGRSNVVKELWAKKGVTFPGTGPICPPHKYSIPVPQTPEEEDYLINLALRESEQTTRIQSDHLSVAHTRSISGARDFRFSQDYTAVNTPVHGRSQSSTYTSTNTASEENVWSLPYGESDQVNQLSFFRARSISRARALDFKFTQDCTAVNVPCQGVVGKGRSNTVFCICASLVNWSHSALLRGSKQPKKHIYKKQYLSALSLLLIVFV